MAAAAAVVVVAIATFEYWYTSADTSAGGGCDGRLQVPCRRVSVAAGKCCTVLASPLSSSPATSPITTHHTIPICAASGPFRGGRRSEGGQLAAALRSWRSRWGRSAAPCHFPCHFHARKIEKLAQVDAPVHGGLQLAKPIDLFPVIEERAQLGGASNDGQYALVEAKLE